MIPKPLDNIALADIESLVSQQASESRSLEFKRAEVGSKDEDKREFLADVSALANTIGGDVIFGIEQIDGTARSLCPLSITNCDAEQQRLESILRSGLEPRLPRCDFKWIPASPGQVLIVRVARSWVAPHRVTFRDHAKFYARATTGKYPMDVAELRASFNSAESLLNRIAHFRRERNVIIELGETPIPLNTGAKFVVHIFSTSSFMGTGSITTNQSGYFAPLGSMGFNDLHTLEGVATYSGSEDSESSRAYTLLFRNGVVEAAAHIGIEHEKHGHLIYPDSIELPLLQRIGSYFDGLLKSGVEAPYYVAMSLLGVRDYSLVSGSRFFYGARHRSLHRDQLFFPELLIEDGGLKSEVMLKPLFDLLWQAFGYPRAFSFDENGKYVGVR